MFRRRHTRSILEPLRVSRDVLESIRQTVGRLAPETGGMLGGNRKESRITHFRFDELAQHTRSTYSPSCDILNRVLADDWNPNGIDLLGFVHSHPCSIRRPSSGDEHYAEKILRAIPGLDRLVLPIVMSESDNGHFELLPFIAVRNRRRMSIREIPLIIEGDPAPAFSELPMFTRVASAYDLDHLQHVRIVAIGCGGAAE